MSKQNMGILLGAFAIVLLASLPVISVFTAGGIASGLGCVLNEDDVHPCPLHGFDLGEMLYGMTVMGWFALGTLPLGAIGLLLLSSPSRTAIAPRWRSWEGNRATQC